MKNIIFNKSGGVAELILNRPNVYNALDFETVTEIETAAKKADQDPEIKVLVVKGAGGNFSAGADLKYLNSVKDSPRLETFIRQINAAFNQLEQCNIPVIASVTGYALAGGFEMLQACDIVFAAEDAKLGDQHVNFGLIPGGGGTQRLPRLIGPQKAKAILFTGMWLNGKEAEKLGLVYQAVPGSILDETVNGFIARLIKKSRDAIKNMKMLVNNGVEINLASAIELELAAFFNHMKGTDANKGLAAFVHKSKPNF